MYTKDFMSYQVQIVLNASLIIYDNLDDQSPTTDYSTLWHIDMWSNWLELDKLGAKLETETRTFESVFLKWPRETVKEITE